MALEADRPALAPVPVTRGPACVLHIRRVRLPRALVALEVRDLVLAPGELTVVFGDSGIGKSCLVDVLSGMMAPAGFEADISGQEIDFDEYRSEEHTSELQSLMRLSYAVFCLKKNYHVTQ